MNKIYKVVDWISKKQLSFFELFVFAILMANDVKWYFAGPVIFASIIISSLLQTICQEYFKSWPVVSKGK